MSELTHQTLPSPEDYRRYDRIWQRVSPQYDPYPAVRAAQPERLNGSLMEEERCCLNAGTDKAEAVGAFLREELADAQICRYLASTAPTQQGKRTLRCLAQEEAGHAKTLQSVYFIMTGGTDRTVVLLPPQPKLLWRERLRERYHEESRAAARYERAAAKTADVCLRRIFERLCADEYRHAEQLRRLLEKAL